MITRRELVQGLAVSSLAPAIAAGQSRSAGSWYRTAIVIDGLGFLRDPYAPDDQLRISDRAFAEIRSTGVTAIRCTTGPPNSSLDQWQDALEDLRLFDSLFSANPDRLLKIERVADLGKAKREGKLGLILGTQESAMIGRGLDRIAELKERGVRAIQLTYNTANLNGDGAIEARNAGLSRLGRETIDRIEAEKILLDLSHGGAATIREALAHAGRPPTISHTGCRSLYDHPRNVWDSELRTLADKGGVVGIYFMPFLTPPERPPRADDVVQHIEHAVRVCGEDHVAIGTDGGILPETLDAAYRERIRVRNQDRARRGVSAPGEASPNFVPVVEELNRLDRFPQLLARLERRRWPQRRLEKLFGGNLARLYAQVWSA